MNIYLNRYEALHLNAIVDYKKFMKEHGVVKYSISGNDDSVKQEYKMKDNTPLVINVEGTYVLMSALNRIAVKPELVYKWRSGNIGYVDWKWQY